jgi:hypothetical protein
MAQVSHLLLAKRALGPLERELVGVESLKDLLDMLLMFGSGSAKHQNVVEEYKNKLTDEGL